MIKLVYVLSCDSCGQTEEEPRRAGTTRAEVLEWAEGTGWWSDPDSVCHYCPACKRSAKLAREMAAHR